MTTVSLKALTEQVSPLATSLLEQVAVNTGNATEGMAALALAARALVANGNADERALGDQFVQMFITLMQAPVVLTEAP